MCQYLERFGGYAGQRELGYLQWCLAHCMDCLVQQDIPGAQEFLAVLALTFVACDQACIDQGRWDLALLRALEEPPPQLFHGRGTMANPRTRAFSPLSPVAWTTCALQFLKEVDLINARRLETLGQQPRSSPPAAAAEQNPADSHPPPKHPPRFPRKPKSNAKRSSALALLLGLGVRDGALSSSQEPLSFTTRVSFASWVGGLLQAVLGTRTPFSLFLKSTLHLPRPAGPAQPSRVGSSVIFPLPMLTCGAFERFPLECGKRFRRRLMSKRLLHLVCMALNFLYADLVPQLRLVARVGRHLKAFGASVGEFALVDSGRRNPQLIARLSELCSFVAATPAATRDRMLTCQETLFPRTTMLLPASSHFAPSMLLAFACLELLPDELRMVHLEPTALLRDVPPPGDVVPVWSKEDPRETKALADLWNSLGLFVVRPTLRVSDSFKLARAFNCDKPPIGTG